MKDNLTLYKLNKNNKDYIIRQLVPDDTKDFINLIVDMYSHLDNLEWFTPMPYDYDNVLGMITNPRFYIIGLFDKNNLVGVSSLDYKCGKLIGKIDFGTECNTDSMVELAFNMVSSQYRGNGLMSEMIKYLIEKLKSDGYEWCMSKVHKDNIASYNSLLKSGLTKLCEYKKGVKKSDFVYLSSQPFFSSIGKQNAEKSLSKTNEDDDELIVEYYIMLKKLY